MRIALVLLLTVSALASDLTDRAKAALAKTSGTVHLAGLKDRVEVIRDRWGVPHIYARNADDLFFAQGFTVAQDRLWQMEMWRRTGEGRLAEILGESALQRDIFARLVRYRGDMEAEWTSYSPDARQIITAFIKGVNAFIEQSSAHPPVEFTMMDFRPEPWTPEVCLLRMAGLIMTGNATSEVFRAELVNRVGADKAAELFPPDPPTKFVAEPGLDLGAITARVLAGYRAAAAPLTLRAADQGSNNWTIAGSRTRSGRPILANDPHRPILLPSLRYTSHLVAPGWSVVGANEPALPGISIGHNDKVAFGLTIFAADQQDLYVEKTDPADSRRYRWNGGWEAMRIEKETFRVKGKAQPVEVELRFTRHGPVIYEDRDRHLAYALRWVGSDPGGAGYLAGLALSRAGNWDEFRKALGRWKTPPENFVYADTAGNIGYQAAGLAPVRSGWNGLLPVPGDMGSREWKGYRPLDELPHAFNPATGFIATANNRTIREDDPNPVGYEWAFPSRVQRIEEVLKSGGKFSIEDMERLQHDETSLPARRLVQMLEGARPDDPRVSQDLRMLLDWNKVVSADSGAAALYELWVQRLVPKVLRPAVPPGAWPLYAPRASMPVALGVLDRSGASRQQILLDALREAELELSGKLGSDRKKWRWGDLHHERLRHPLSSDFDLPRVERGGDATTVNATSFVATTYRQTSGASYREIFDVGAWDNSVTINVPGESGQPGSPHYGDLLPLWAAGKYHPLPFSRKAVEQYASEKLTLLPQ